MSSDNTIFPEPDVLNELEMGKFVLANLAAKRAKQIKEGAPPLVRINSSHPLSIALAEIAAGKIKPIMGSDAEAMEDQDLEAAMEDLTVDEMGLLLPGLEEDEDSEETVAVKKPDLDLDLDDIDEDDDDDDDDDSKSSDDDEGISSLLDDDDDDDDSSASSSDDDSITLDELAEKEEEASDDESDN